MAAGYAQNAFVEKDFKAFNQVQSSGVMPEFAIFASTLPACVKMGASEWGMDIHYKIKERGGVVTIAPVDMLTRHMNCLTECLKKCGQLNAMIAGYTQKGFVEKASEAFEQMQLAGVRPDSATFASILIVCVMGALEQGMDIH